MTMEDNAASPTEQLNMSELAYKRLLDLAGVIEYGKLEFLHDLQDRLEVELSLGHFHGPKKHLFRAAADLCDDAIRRRHAEHNTEARDHATTIAARMQLFLERTREILGK